MKCRVAALAALTLFGSAQLAARERPFDPQDGPFLIKACQEVVEIYQRRDETRLLASTGTSMSEAMRAGYCIGVVQQYRRSGSACNYSYLRVAGDWFQMAEAVAQAAPQKSMNGVLEKALCDG